MTLKNRQQLTGLHIPQPRRVVTTDRHRLLAVCPDGNLVRSSLMVFARLRAPRDLLPGLSGPQTKRAGGAERDDAFAVGSECRGMNFTLVTNQARHEIAGFRIPQTCHV